MDRFVRNFIIMSIVYLGVATAIGLLMLYDGKLMGLKFVHSHLMLLGWVSMMIYGVGYHILPKFKGRQLYSSKIGEFQFWLANLGMVGMLVFYTLNIYTPSGLYKSIMIASGFAEVISIFLFFFNMLMTLVPELEQQ